MRQAFRVGDWRARRKGSATRPSDPWINAICPASAPESESAGQDPPVIQAVRLSPVLSGQSVRKL
jgi:hypothetical protein